MYKFICKQIPPQSYYFWLYFASFAHDYIFVLFLCIAADLGMTSENPIFDVFEAKYLWKYLSVRRMVYIIRIIFLWWIFEKQMVIMSYAL